jgi:hypothetical protein
VPTPRANLGEHQETVNGLIENFEYLLSALLTAWKLVRYTHIIIDFDSRRNTVTGSDILIYSNRLICLSKG